MQKYIYLLEHHSGKQPVNVGVFTSLARAKQFIKTLPKTLAYVVYQLPTNKRLTQGRKLKDVQGLFDHWHFGTYEIDEVEIDKNGKTTIRRNKKIRTWPE